MCAYFRLMMLAASVLHHRLHETKAARVRLAGMWLARCRFMCPGARGVQAATSFISNGLMHVYSQAATSCKFELVFVCSKKLHTCFSSCHQLCGCYVHMEISSRHFMCSSILMPTDLSCLFSHGQWLVACAFRTLMVTSLVLPVQLNSS